MTKILNTIFLAVLTCFIAVGCATSLKEIQAKSVSLKTDVFIEVENTESTPPKGFADVVVKTSVKTHTGDHSLWWIKDGHGKHGYPFVLNIDGQAMTWGVDAQEDIIPKTGEFLENPEAGSGVKYVTEKRIRVKSGRIALFFGLPEEGLYSQVEIVVTEAGENVLEFKPVYCRGVKRNFCFGVESFEVFLNGTLIQ